MDSQAEVIEALSRPETFGAEIVEVVETHASIVFLADDRAFKLKRAARYSHVDYSTLELRHQACLAEHAINRRFAPALYLGVEPVVRRDGQLRLGGEGIPVEWVVVMRRFEQAARLDHMAARNTLTPDLMKRLAETIAALHQSAALRPADGGVAGLGRALEMTADSLRLEAGATFTPDDVADWTTRARTALAEQAILLDRRKRSGKVRACHGDLHLRNICMVDDVPTPFDAMEFDPHLSSIDVLYDLAFLLMDLHERGLGQLNNILFNRYLDLGNDGDGFAALPLFMALRAAIRAQVAASNQHETGVPSAVRKFRAEAVRYLVLARKLIEPSPPGSLIAIGGLSGTGKSTLAYALAPGIGRPPGARVICSDVIRKQIAGVPLERGLGAETFTKDTTATTYAAFIAEIWLCLNGGHSVIADAVFANAADRRAVEEAARSLGTRFRGLWLTAPKELLLDRVAGRSADVSDATPDVVLAQLEGVPPPAGWRVVEAGGPAESVLSAAVAALAE